MYTRVVYPFYLAGLLEYLPVSAITRRAWWISLLMSPYMQVSSHLGTECVDHTKHSRFYLFNIMLIKKMNRKKSNFILQIHVGNLCLQKHRNRSHILLLLQYLECFITNLQTYKIRFPFLPFRIYLSVSLILMVFIMNSKKQHSFILDIFYNSYILSKNFNSKTMKIHVNKDIKFNIYLFI